jgi:hypothetical protein
MILANCDKCIILVPVGSSIETHCEEALRSLEHRGNCVRRVSGYTSIDQARNEIVSKAIEDGFEETMWIDSDIGFNPDDVEKLRSHNLPLTCGIYPKKGERALAIHSLPGTERIQFGTKGGLCALSILLAAC